MRTVITLTTEVLDTDLGPVQTISVDGHPLPPEAYESLMDWFADLPAPKEGA